MDGYQFISALISALAWPIAAVVMVALLRRSISKLLRRMRAMKYGDASVEFAEKIQEATIAADEIAADPAAPPVLQAPEEKDRYTKLAELAPTLAVIEVWQSVEEAVISLAEARHIDAQSAVRTGVTNSTRPVMPTPRMYRELLNAGVIDENTHALLRQLNQMRNMAAHSRNYALSAEDALRYKALADTVIAALRATAALPVPDPPGN